MTASAHSFSPFCRLYSNICCRVDGIMFGHFKWLAMTILWMLVYNFSQLELGRKTRSTIILLCAMDGPFVDVLKTWSHKRKNHFKGNLKLLEYFCTGLFLLKILLKDKPGLNYTTLILYRVDTFPSMSSKVTF